MEYSNRPLRAVVCQAMPEIRTDCPSPSILIVEDEILVAMNLCMAFEDDGMQIVGPARTLSEALNFLASETWIDAAVLDVDLSGHEVFPVADQLQTQGVPFIFHTGHETQLNLNLKYPSAEVFSKPSSPDQLVQRIQSLLDRM